MRGRQVFAALVILVLTGALQGCNGASHTDMPVTGLQEESIAAADTSPGKSAGGAGDSYGEPVEDSAAPAQPAGEGAPAAEAPGQVDISEAGREGGNGPDTTQEARENTMYLRIGTQTLTATLAENSSAEALKELLAGGPVTIDLRDYGNFEKVGDLGVALPTNDAPITTGPGDLILYQGNSFVIYYDTNSWSLTRLGRIDDVTGDRLKEILGSGDVRVTLSLEPGQ